MNDHASPRATGAKPVQPPAPPEAAPAAPPVTQAPAVLRKRFDGLPPVEHLGRVLRNAAEGKPKGVAGRFLVLTHRGPDPDALGACEGLRLVIEKGFAFRCVVATHGRVHRAENLALIRTLELELEEYSKVDPTGFCGALLVDTQPAFAHTVIPDDLPILAVFDHHRSPQEEGGDSTLVAPHTDVRLDLGASSSILYEYVRDLDLPLDERTASALFCGIRYDTADLSRNASPLDEEAYFETFRKADRRRVSRIDAPPLPRSHYREVARALAEARQHGPLVLALLERVENPEHVAEMADYFLRMKGVSWVLAGGAYNGDYVLSLRTDSRFGNAYPLMDRVLDGRGSFGGHGHIAGGRLRLRIGDDAEIQAVEAELRDNALEVISSSESPAPEGRPLYR